MSFMELISVGYEDTKYLINRFVLQWEVGRLWRVSDCEELSGGYSQGMMGMVLERVTLNMRYHINDLQ